MLQQKQVRNLLFISIGMILFSTLIGVVVGISDLLANLSADILFIGLAILGFIWSWNRGYGKVKQFFGIGPKGKLRIFVSSRSLSDQTSKYVSIVEELRAVSNLTTKLLFHIKGGTLISIISGIVNIESIDLSDVSVDIGNDDKTFEVNDGVLFVGGPVQNDLSKKHFPANSKWIGYLEEEKKDEKGEVIKKPNGAPETEFSFVINKEKIDSGNKAALFKVKVVDRFYIFAWGYGELQTAGAVRYLANNWQIIHEEYQEEFGILLDIENVKGNILSTKKFYP